MSTIEKINEKVLISSLLLESSGKGSSTIDTFSSWLLAGFATAVAFLIGNANTISSHIPGFMLKNIISILVLVFALGVIQKFLAAAIGATVSGAAVGRELAAEFLKGGHIIDMPYIYTEVENSLLPPMRWFAKYYFKKTASGDIAAPSRFFYHCAEVQSLIVIAQAIAVFYCIYIVSDVIVF